MNEEQLRALVRAAVQRHVGDGGRPEEVRSSNFEVRTSTPTAHASHYQYVALVNAGDACLIESSVECNHCGYCRSHGH